MWFIGWKMADGQLLNCALHCIDIFVRMFLCDILLPAVSSHYYMGMHFMCCSVHVHGKPYKYPSHFTRLTFLCSSPLLV